MSSIKNLAIQIEMNMKGKEEEEELIEMSKNIESKKTSITSRYDPMQVAYLDMLAEKRAV